MKKNSLILSSILFMASISISNFPSGEPDWSADITVFESCSCPVFCQCFFTGKPPEECGMNKNIIQMSYCRFNQAYKVNKGHYGDINLDGIKFWFAGDAGTDFALPKLDWAVLTFDASVKKEQKDALLKILYHLHFYKPERWKSYNLGRDASMDWSFNSDSANASLDGGKTAQLVLRLLDGGMNKPVTMNNMDYFGFPRNDGFILMPNEIEAYKIGEKAFTYKGTNGLVTTVDISSKDFKNRD